MTSTLLNRIMAMGVVILLAGILWDIIALSRQRTMLELLSNYIQFEKRTIEQDRLKWIKLIKTSISFKHPARQAKLSGLTGFESMPIHILEKQILTLHPDISTLDSLPYGNDDIPKYRRLMNQAENKAIKSFYSNLLEVHMLEELNSNVYDDSDFGLSNWMIIRSGYSDSTYIGARFYPDGRSKYAYRINNRYFEGLYASMEYTIPNTDTLDIETIALYNKGTEIDTQVIKQRLLLEDGQWREKAQ